MTHQYQCPKCDYTAGTRGSVKGHITRRTDELHKGLSGPEHHDEITQVSVDSDGPSASGDATPDGNPAMSGPSAETGTQQPQTESSGTELPCGCETVDLSTADPPVIIECETCGREYPYE